MPQPQSIKSHTARLAQHLRETWTKLCDAYSYRGSWIDIQLYHRSHDNGLQRKMHVCWPADIEAELLRNHAYTGSRLLQPASDQLDAIGFMRHLELGLRSFQLVGWVIYSVQRRIPDGSERLQLNWVWQMKREPAGRTVLADISEGDPDRPLSSEPTL